MYLCRIYAAASVPDELLEAARIDGAGEVRIFTALVLRIMTPALVTSSSSSSCGIWNNYFLPLVMLSDSKLYPITLGLTSWQSFADRQPQLYQLTVGGAFVSVVPLMIADGRPPALLAHRSDRGQRQGLSRRRLPGVAVHSGLEPMPQVAALCVHVPMLALASAMPNAATCVVSWCCPPSARTRVGQ